MHDLLMLTGRAVDFVAHFQASNWDTRDGYCPFNLKHLLHFLERDGVDLGKDISEEEFEKLSKRVRDRFVSACGQATKADCQYWTRATETAQHLLFMFDYDSDPSGFHFNRDQAETFTLRDGSQSIKVPYDLALGAYNKLSESERAELLYLIWLNALARENEIISSSRTRVRRLTKGGVHSTALFAKTLQS